MIKSAGNGVPITTKGYAAPELYTDNYDRKCDLYSVGVLVWELINGRCISSINIDRNFDFQFLNKPANCSKKLWLIILKATKENPQERYENPEEMLTDIYKCRKYKKGRNRTFLNTAIGTITTLSEKDIMKPIYVKQNSDLLDRTCILTGEQAFAYNNLFINVKKAYLIRKNTYEIIAIDKESFIIGTASEKVDFRLTNNKTISRMHACILVENGKYYLQDCNSSNGTFLNNIKLKQNEKSEIKNSDVIKLADEEFVFKID